MTGTPLRCHLLIGPPGSGKTTLAHQLAPLLPQADGGPGLVLPKGWHLESRNPRLNAQFPK
jgi:energy-coupling factor transporter ATP-binding protein EcfA2